jgi:hypothetical protein
VLRNLPSEIKRITLNRNAVSSLRGTNGIKPKRSRGHHRGTAREESVSSGRICSSWAIEVRTTPSEKTPISEEHSKYLNPSKSSLKAAYMLGKQ